MNNVTVVCRLIRKLWKADFTVLEEGTEEPLAGALITVGSKTALSGVDGKATIGPFKAGTYEFTVVLAGFEDYAGSFTTT